MLIPRKDDGAETNAVLLRNGDRAREIRAKRLAILARFLAVVVRERVSPDLLSGRIADRCDQTWRIVERIVILTIAEWLVVGRQDGIQIRGAENR